MIGRTRWHLREVDSTQRIAFDLAAYGAAHGTIVRADFQSAGRGRQGRSWVAPAGSSLMFSVILRPDQPLHELATASILTAKVLAGVFEEITSEPVHIKWPNDVLIGGRKVSGILLQTRNAPTPVAVLGIGVNINLPEQHLAENAISLAQAADIRVDADLILDRVLVGLEEMWRNLSPQLNENQVSTINECLWLRDEEVTLLDGSREITGHILGVAENGGLVLSNDPINQVIVAGEITRGPRPVSHPRSQ